MKVHISSQTSVDGVKSLNPLVLSSHDLYIALVLCPKNRLMYFYNLSSDLAKTLLFHNFKINFVQTFLLTILYCIKSKENVSQFFRMSPTIALQVNV